MATPRGIGTGEPAARGARDARGAWDDAATIARSLDDPEQFAVVFRALPPIKVAGDPVAIAITPDGKTAYVASTTAGTVTPIRTATNTALPPIKVGRYPTTIAITW